MKLLADTHISPQTVITLRLASCRVEHFDQLLEKVLPAIEQDALAGCLISVEEQRVRSRPLPLE